MKHFTVEKLRALTMPETKAEREELVNALFDDYKNVTARIHFADTVAEGDAELKAALGDACLAIATSTNTIDGTQFQTVLPTVEQCFSPANDSNTAAKSAEQDAVIDNFLNEETEVVADQPVVDQVEEVPVIETKEQLKEFNDSVKDDIAAENAEDAAQQPVGESEAGKLADKAPAKKKKAKLSDEDVAEIRELLAKNEMKQSAIAKQFEIDPSTVSDIKCNRGRYAVEYI